MVKFTQAQFSMHCSFIAKNAADWAACLLTLPENYGAGADLNTVYRFTEEMRRRLDYIDKAVGSEHEKSS